LYLHNKGRIESASFTTSSKIVGAVNEMKIQFEPKNFLPISQGQIEVYTQVWAAIYDKNLKKMVNQYPIGADGFECSSD
jgi:hypothetical protein